LLDGVAPLVAIDEVVPVGDEVAQRTTLVTERHAAVHAPRALAAQFGVGLQREVLVVIAHAAARVALVKADPVDLQECAELAHGALEGSRGLLRPRLAPPPRTRRRRAPPAPACSHAA